jgi:hypothetical protein
MRATFRLGIIAALACCVALCLAGRSLNWSLARALLRELERSAALEHRDRQALRCIERRRAVAGELVAGRLRLAEAARAFAEATDAVEDAPGLAPYRQAATERGWWLNVLRYVPEGPALDRLEGEYREHFGEAPPPHYRDLPDEITARPPPRPRKKRGRGHEAHGPCRFCLPSARRGDSRNRRVSLSPQRSEVGVRGR